MKTLRKEILGITVASLSLATLFLSGDTMAQRKGDSARITIGIVEGAQRVQLESNSGRNALIGGALGWGLARNQSSGRQAAAAIGGATLGGAATSSAEGNRNAMQYSVRTSAGSLIQVVTDQTEIRLGDCVLVEESGDKANIRRKDQAMCQASPEAKAVVNAELQDDADQCARAKQRLFDATTQEEVNVAKQVMEILCND